MLSTQLRRNAYLYTAFGPKGHLKDLPRKRIQINSLGMSSPEAITVSTPPTTQINPHKGELP